MRFVSHLACSACGATYPADRRMNLCERDGRPVQMVLDLDRLRGEPGTLAGYDPSRPDLWRFGGLMPCGPADPEFGRHSAGLSAGHTPLLPYEHPLARRLGLRLEVKDEGKPYPGWGRNPTLSFKDRGMVLVVTMARALGISRLVVPTQGNAGDSLAHLAIAGGLEAAIVMSPDTDAPVLGSVAALAARYPDRLRLELVPGTIVDAAARVREHYLPRGYFNVATFQEPGWRTEGKKSLGLELAEPRPGESAWRPPDVIVYPTGGGTGIVGMAKAFDELEGLGLIDGRRPRFVCVQATATAPLLRAYESGAVEPGPMEAGATVATGLNVARNVGHINVLKIVRANGGAVLGVTDAQIRATIRAEWAERRFAWSPEGAATLAALDQLIERGLARPGEHVVLVNTASAEKYLPSIRGELGGGL